MTKEPAYTQILQGFNLRSAIGFAISGVLLWLTFYNSGLHLNDIQLKEEQWYYFSAAIAVFVFSLWLYSLRAKLVWMSPTKKSSELSTYSSLILGNFYNSILPGNLGEGVRAFHFARKNKVTFIRSLAAILTEKWLDAQVFAVLVVVLFIIKPFTPHYISYTLVYTSLVVLLLTIIHVFFQRNRELEKWVWHLMLLLKKPGLFLFKAYSNSNSHLRNMRQQGHPWVYVGVFAFIFFLNVMQFYFLLKAAGVSEPVGGMYSAFMIGLSMMIIAFIPSAPGSIGVLHYGLYSVLLFAASLYHIVPDAKALQSYALFGIYTHLSYFIPEIILGTVFMVKERAVIFDRKVD